MTNTQIKLFWEEVDLIQKRHSLFFPDSQKENISISKTDTGSELYFMDDYDLPQCITMEIQLALKIILGLPPDLK